jgi:hypothetical protein
MMLLMPMRRRSARRSLKRRYRVPHIMGVLASLRPRPRQDKTWCPNTQLKGLRQMP